jgi:hypothetical protein
VPRARRSLASPLSCPSLASPLELRGHRTRRRRIAGGGRGRAGGATLSIAATFPRSAWVVPRARGARSRRAAGGAVGPARRRPEFAGLAVELDFQHAAQPVVRPARAGVAHRTRRLPIARCSRRLDRSQKRCSSAPPAGKHENPFSRRGVPGHRGAGDQIAWRGRRSCSAPMLRTWVVLGGCPARSLTAVGPRAGLAGLGRLGARRGRGGAVEQDACANSAAAIARPIQLRSAARPIGGPAEIARHVRRQPELAATTWSRGPRARQIEGRPVPPCIG